MKIIDKLGWEVVILFVTGIGFIGFSWGVGEWFKKDALIWSYIVIVCALFWRKMEKKIREYKFEDTFYPTMMVAQGTYYTFIGISAILITFGTNNNGNQFVEVKELLAGLRLAFITSVIGLISSIVAKMYMKKKATEYLESAPYQEYVLLEDDQMYRALIEMKNSLSDQGDMLKEVQYDLVNESQKSIIKSVEKLTDNIGEIIEKRITEAIDKNAQAVNETIRSNRDMFIAALAQCNAKFMSSFEEYRVALNLAKDTIGVISRQATDVNKRLKDSMDKINESVDRTAMTVSGLSTTLETIRNQYEASDKWFAETLAAFERIDLLSIVLEINKTMEQIETATNNVSGSLCSTGQTIQNLTNQFTTIGGNLMMLRDTMETYRDKSSKDSEKVVAKQEETVEMLNNQNNAYYDRLYNTQMKFEENLNSLANDFAKVLQTEHAQIEQLTEILTKLNEKIEAKDLEQSSGFDVDNHFGRI